MSTIPQPEAIAAKALRDWLLLKLPAACVAVNAERAAVLTSPTAGDFTIPASASLKVSLTGTRDNFTTCSLTSGTRTAAQVVADINSAMGATVAAANSNGQVVLTSTTAPSFSGITGTNSSVAVGPDTTGANLALGFDAGGEWQVTTPVLPPTPLGVADGFPAGGFFMPAALGHGRIVVAIGERTSSLVGGNMRRAEWEVSLEVGIFRAEPQQASSQSREGIQAALRCLRSCIHTDAGKQLGRAAAGDVVRVAERSASVSPWAFRQQRQGQEAVSGLLFDAATLRLALLVFQFPPAS